jgi:hypothetical protein
MSFATARSGSFPFQGVGRMSAEAGKAFSDSSERMKAYCHSTCCRHEFLVNYFAPGAHEPGLPCTWVTAEIDLWHKAHTWTAPGGKKRGVGYLSRMAFLCWCFCLSIYLSIVHPAPSLSPMTACRRLAVNWPAPQLLGAGT